VTYQQLLERMFGLRRFGVRPGLEVTRAALAAVGDPHLNMPAIHVAGTNGKGSTAAIIESLLREAGVRTGLYTSPHLLRFTERIRISGVELSQREAAALGEVALDAAPDATFFEIATVMAFAAFRERGVEVAVLETGLGGRLDSTNVVDTPLATVVTGIALDHAEVLGSTLPEIAREKAGIFKRGVPAVIGCEDAAARAVLLDEAARVGAPVWLRGRDFPSLSPLPVALAGSHQQGNAALALCAVERAGFDLDEPLRRRALHNVRWPARLESLAPDVMVDAAHNADGARALARALPRDRAITLVFGVVADKQPADMLHALLPLAARVILTRPPSPRARDPESLRELAPDAEIAPSLEEALRMARNGSLVVVTGSIFLAGEARRLLLGEPADPIAAQDPAAGKNL
jgi:dihydrofolate synthase / folylpolyglutamate synthase